MATSDRTARDLPAALGWFSAALGSAQVLAPGVVSRVAGVEPTRGTRSLMRLIGVRELGAAAGIFGAEPAPFLWARVAGDVMDVALTMNALRSDRHARRATVTLAALLGITALDLVAAARRSAQLAGSKEQGPNAQRRRHMEAKSAITVNAGPDRVYEAWHDFERLPTFMHHLESVTMTGAGRSHWVAKGPAGTTAEWDAETVEDAPGRRIAWRSTDGSSVENAGSVRFEPAPGDQGTEVHVELTYSPPGGALASVFAKLFGEEPNQQIKDDLRRFKQLIETGEIVRSESTPQGNSPTERNPFAQRPAQPVDLTGDRTSESTEVRT
jgi:uncharacterized membrane protein